MRMPGITCPTCNKANDGNAAATMRASKRNVGPTPGDVSLCFYCGALGIFERRADEPMRLRFPTDAERAELLADDEIVHAMSAVRAFHEGDAAIFEQGEDVTTPESFAATVAESDVVLCFNRATDLIQQDSIGVGFALQATLFNPANVNSGSVAAALRALADRLDSD